MKVNMGERMSKHMWNGEQIKYGGEDQEKNICNDFQTKRG